jgi:DNA-binding transcriptional LysR family regulator
VAIWKEGSLSAAATRLNTSAATVTRKLRDLENQLGVVLFERTTRALRITPTGEELAIRLERALSEIDIAVEAVRQQDEHIRGLVRVSVPPNLAQVLGPMFSRFRSGFPEVQLRVYATERRLIYATEDVDVLLRVGRLEEEGLVAKPLARFRHVLCGTPTLRRKIRRPADLERAVIAAWASNGPPAAWHLERDGDVVKVTIDPALVTNDYDLIAHAICNDQMVGELPGLVAAPMLKSKEVVRLLPKWRLPEVTLSILYPAHRLLPSSVRALTAHMRSEFAALGG